MRINPLLPEKQRARYRLAGALILVLAAVIALPKLLFAFPARSRRRDGNLGRCAAGGLRRFFQRSVGGSVVRIVCETCAQRGDERATQTCAPKPFCSSGRDIYPRAGRARPVGASSESQTSGVSGAGKTRSWPFAVFGAGRAFQRP